MLELNLHVKLNKESSFPSHGSLFCYQEKGKTEYQDFCSGLERAQDYLQKRGYIYF